MRRLRVCSFESRRSDEIGSLIERSGGEATVVASMREVPLDANPAAFAFAESLLAGQIDVVVFLTGVGARTLADVVATRFDRAAFLEALRRCSIAVRGPKPAVVLREWQVPIAARAAEPNTWRELLSALDSAGLVANKRMAVQEYGRPNEEFYHELAARGAQVQQVPVYRWMLPEDVAPLERAIRQTIAGEFDVLLFTSAHQLDSVLEVAERLQRYNEWLKAARACVIGSIGPTCSETIREHALPVDVEASPTKMGQLVVATLEAAAEILKRKRA